VPRREPEQAVLDPGEAESGNGTGTAIGFGLHLQSTERSGPRELQILPLHLLVRRWRHGLDNGLLPVARIAKAGERDEKFKVGGIMTANCRSGIRRLCF